MCLSLGTAFNRYACHIRRLRSINKLAGFHVVCLLSPKETVSFFYSFGRFFNKPLLERFGRVRNLYDRICTLSPIFRHRMRSLGRCCNLLLAAYPPVNISLWNTVYSSVLVLNVV